MLILCCAMSDEELKSKDELIEDYIQQMGKGNKEVMSKLYALIRNDIFSLALVELRNYHDAEDILNQTFLEIWRYSSGYIPMKKPMAWIFKIERHLIIAHIKEGKNTPMIPTQM